MNEKIYQKPQPEAIDNYIERLQSDKIMLENTIERLEKELDKANKERDGWMDRVVQMVREKVEK